MSEIPPAKDIRQGFQSRVGLAGPQGGRGASGQIMRWLSRVAVTIPLLALVGIIAVLFSKAWPAIKFNGLGYLTRTDWKPGNQYATSLVRTNGVLHLPNTQYGALPLIVGTVLTSLVAIVVALPVSIGAAVALTSRIPSALGKAIGLILEILAGIPSVIIGLWGSITLGKFLARDISPILVSTANSLPNVFPLNFFRGNVGQGEGLFAASMVLAIMIIPIIATTTRDLLSQVPILTQEGGAALGMSDWEVLKWISVPWIKSGVIGAAVLGLARALGETMAVAMVSGAVLSLPISFYNPMTTIAATIVSQLDSAFTDGTGFAVANLAELALVLMLITLGVNVLARILVRRSSTVSLPVGSGL